MKTYDLQGSPRSETGKKESRKLRNEGLVPCVLYCGEKNVHFSVPEKQFKNLVFTHDVYLVKLDIEGEKFDAVIKDIQFHPVSDHIIHVDFSQVSPGKKVILDLPIQLTGNAAGMLEGGKIRQRRRKLKVKGLVEHMPEHLEIDISSLEIGDSLKVGDIEYENLEVLDAQRAMVVGVVSSRLVAKGLREALPEEVAEEEAAAEAEAPEEEEEGAAEEEKSEE